MSKVAISDYTFEALADKLIVFPGLLRQSCEKVVKRHPELPPLRHEELPPPLAL